MGDKIILKKGTKVMVKNSNGGLGEKVWEIHSLNLPTGSFQTLGNINYTIVNSDGNRETQPSSNLVIYELSIETLKSNLLSLRKKRAIIERKIEILQSLGVEEVESFVLEDEYLKSIISDSKISVEEKFKIIKNSK